MPTYQYACKDSACGHRFEAVQSFSDDPLSACPVCEGQVRKVFSAVGVVFKGSGFYRTDSRDSAKAAAGGDGKAKENGSSSDSTSSTPSSDSSGNSSSPAGASSGSASSSAAAASGSSSGSSSKAAAS